ncbi:MAG: signal recognition particle-docking protein FtsY [Bacillota bacterium]|nr:signal recognition particle-docking protein FtsY [Bacillota bacterium]
MGLFDKMFSGLSKTRKNMEDLEELFRDFNIDSDDFYDELEEQLIMADVGAENVAKIIYNYKYLLLGKRINRDGRAAKAALVELMKEFMGDLDSGLKLETKPSVILMVGVNGVGKTTTIGKLSARLMAEGKKVLLCAGDTFRAAAAEQLGIWAERSGAEFVRHEEGSDPAAVVYDGICAAKARGVDTVIIDTAGRLHNKANLMNELNKIRRVITRELPEADVETLMVLDATTGQNGLIQAKQFLETAGLTGIVLTKLDGTAKGGIVFAIAQDLKLPVKFVGVGEGIDDLIPFDGNDFVEALFKE